MKLFKVECKIRYDVLVVADDAETADKLTAEQFGRAEITKNLSAMTMCGIDTGSVTQLTKLEQVPEEWRNSYMYFQRREDKVKTPEEFFESQTAGEG